ncbi:MAG: N-acetyl-gamma-glutamyl-phosphate reductase [Oscillospiraceae bacterium]|jgi:N-acetyl-gamma-glutamyl-phosphate reductase, uncommon form|nr:N-acetyl-gamma-glutamyl-phosphate reductase [Oscillospiraceae bacterium]
MTKVFIDGSAGTTGLRIQERLSGRTDLELITLSGEQRRDRKAREEAVNAADVAFFCLPDAAAVEAAALVHGDTAVIDTSTAHRTAPGWVYGFPELFGQREKIAASRRIANPGCHASGFIALVEPLVHEGLIAPDTALSCFSVTGYSGGGKAMIAQYRDENRPAELDAPRQYATGQQHKHLREMQLIPALAAAPVFCPIVADYYSGMVVTVPLFAGDLRGRVEDVAALYRERYHSAVVHYEPDDGGLIAGNALADRDDMTITVAGNDERILLISRFDNLGKGASGAAIQNLNILLGLDETLGLNLGEETA